MQKFEIILKNDRVKAYRSFALILLVSNLVLFIFMLAYDYKRYEAAAALILTGTYLLIRIYMARKNNQKYYIDELVFFILAGSWIGLHNYIIVLICIVTGILYHLTLQKLKFVFTSDIVQKLNFPKVEYTWNLFTNVMVKDNILTIDLVNNKLMQLELENGEDIDESEFNEFARGEISMHKQNILE